jgi:hypothetical protein
MSKRLRGGLGLLGPHRHTEAPAETPVAAAVPDAKDDLNLPAAERDADAVQGNSKGVMCSTIRRVMNSHRKLGCHVKQYLTDWPD